MLLKLQKWAAFLPHPHPCHTHRFLYGLAMGQLRGLIEVKTPSDQTLQGLFLTSSPRFQPGFIPVHAELEQCKYRGLSEEKGVMEYLV